MQLPLNGDGNIWGSAGDMKQQETEARLVSRRTLTRGAAWAAPVMVVAAAAPAYAASLRKDPGINGWVLNTPTDLTGSCRWSLRVDSTPSPAGATPDGAPFGLYVYDTLPSDVLTQARITYWIIGNQTATWAANAQHSSCWSNPVRGTPSVKSDGQTYTPYTFTYACAINAAATTTGPDGVARLFLGGFDTTATFTQPASLCNDVTYWTQRFITINGVQYTFERRNGTRGAISPAARAAQGAQGASAAGPAVS